MGVISDIVGKVSVYLKSKGVFTAVDSRREFVKSGSMGQAKDSVDDTIKQISSSTWMSGSLNRYRSELLNVSTFPELTRMQQSMVTSFKRSGSTLVHHDPASGSGIFVSGSYYSIKGGKGQSRGEVFTLMTNAIENKLEEKVAKIGGKLDISAEASASFTGSIQAIRSI